MNPYLKQRRGLLTIEAEVLPIGVRRKERGPFRSYESMVRFEELPDEITRAFYVSRLYLAISGFFLFLLVYRFYEFSISGKATLGGLLFSALWFVVAAIGTWMQSPHYIGFHSGATSLMFFDVKGKEDPTQFLMNIKKEVCCARVQIKLNID